MQSLKGLSNRVLLVILDGFGLRDNSLKNAIANAHKPNIDNLMEHYPHTTIEAGGEAVGLPAGVAGNSEVGHMNLGAGRSIRQDLIRINEAIENQTLATMPQMLKLIEFAKSHSRRIHIMGLLSDGGVHSHIDHLKAISDILAKEPELEVFFHAFMDGRDTAPNVGAKYIDEVQSWNTLHFASVQGRSIGMDRDRRWEKIKRCYDTLTGKGIITSETPLDYLKKEYENNIFDEFIHPVLFDKNYAIGPEDAIFFINFRPDRAIQISLAFNDPNFKEFKRDFIPKFYLCMTPYIEEEVRLPILFNKERVVGGISEKLSELGLNQYKIAETEKYAHITYFFNGGRKEPFKGEDQILVPSPKEVATYDQKPEMSAFEVTEKLVKALENPHYSFYLVNYANSDMVGHTGKFEAAVKAIETVDECVGKLMDQCEKQQITMLITADHGNSDQMIYENGSPHTSHTNSKVPFIVFHPKLKDNSLELNDPSEIGFALRDVGPTAFYTMSLALPKEYTGINIFK